jgi:uncharacterized membrane protein
MFNINNFKTKLLLPPKLFIILSLIFGIIFVFLTPIFRVSDEKCHFYKAYQISKLHFKGIKIENQVGDYIPEYYIKESFAKKSSLSQNKFSFQDFRNTAVYPPIAYIPQSIAISIGEIIKLNPTYIFYLGRILNLLSWIILLYWSIKIIPVYKWTLFLIGLLPISVFLAGSLSPDAVTNGFGFLLTALVLNLTFSDKESLNKKDICLLALITIIATFCKGYIFLPMLLFLIPKSKFGGAKKYILTILLIYAAALTVNLLWVSYVKDIVIPITFDANYHKQLEYIINNPIMYLISLAKLIIRTFLIPLQQNYDVMSNTELVKILLKSLFSYDGLQKILKDKVLFTSLLNILIYIIGFAFIFSVSLIESSKEICISIKNKVILFAVYLLTFILVSTNIYLSYNIVGSKEIIGVQSRYFIITLPIFLLLFYNYKFLGLKFKIEKNLSYIIPSFALLTLITSAIIAYSRYYN